MRSRFVSRRVWQALAAASAVAVVPVLVPAGASAAPKTVPNKFCVAETVPKADGSLTVVPGRDCYATEAEATAVAEAIAAAGASEANTRGAGLLASGTAIFYDGFNGGGASPLVVPISNCSSTTLNFLLFWVNKVSSTSTSCSSVKHCDSPAGVGAFEITPNGGPHNLTTMNNRAESFVTS